MTTLPSFDELKRLAETDPLQLEALRMSLSESVINEAPEDNRPQLRAMMSHINRVIAHGKNPNHVNAMLMRDLMRQFGRFQKSLTSLTNWKRKMQKCFPSHLPSVNRIGDKYYISERLFIPVTGLPVWRFHAGLFFRKFERIRHISPLIPEISS